MSWISPHQEKSSFQLSKFRNGLEWFFFFVIVLGVWQFAALSIHNPLVCPTPWQVILAMVEQCQAPTFWPAISTTIIRALFALGFSFGAALPISFLGAFYPWCGGFFNRLVSVFQTVPNVCYIVLLLFWTSREQTVIITGFFLLFPLLYRSFYEALGAIQKQWHAVWTLYPQPKFILMGKICFPLLRYSLLAAIKSASSLSFKVCVTSEILTGLMVGIGKRMQMARLNLDLAGVIGWSLWLVILVFMFEMLWSFCIDRFLGD